MSTTKFFRFPWATSGDKTPIPDAVQPSGTVSYTEGFGFDYERDPATDPLAKRVPRDETNQLYSDITENLRSWQLAGLPEWVTAAQNGGTPVNYPINAMVRHNLGGTFLAYQSLIDNNTVEPGSDPTKWAVVTPFSFSALEASATEALAGSVGGKVITPRRMATAVQRGEWTYATASGTANALIVNLSPTATARPKILLIKATLANTASAVTINVNGLGFYPIVARGGEALRRGDIQPGPQLLLDNGSAYELVGSGGTLRTPLQADLNLYVSTTGSDSNDGLDPARPFLTLQKAWSEIVSNYDLNGFVATVNIADGTYNAGVSATSAPLGGNSGAGSVIFKSSSGNAANVTVTAAAGNTFLAQGGASYTLQDITVSATGTLASAVVAGPGGIIAVSGLRFGAATQAQLNASGGFIQASGNYSVVAGAPYHAVASFPGVFTNAGRTITLVGTPAFSGAWVYCEQGRVDSSSTLYSGGATGSRYDVRANGVLRIGGVTLPGNAVGTQATGGQVT